MRFKFLLFFAFFIGSVLSSKASHVAGGDISYVHLAGDSFLIKLKLYEDCSGLANLSTISQNITFSSSCAFFQENLPFLSNTEVSQLCGNDLNNSSCNNGSLPGILEYK